MPNPTIPAAGEAMPAEGQTRRRFFAFAGKATALTAVTGALVTPAFASAAALPVAGAASGALAAEPQSSFDDKELIALGRLLKDLDLKKTSWPDDDNDGYGRIYEQHWDLRHRINMITAHTLAGLQVKAFAADVAYRDDTNVDCVAPGSFVALSRSIARDLLWAATLKI